MSDEAQDPEYARWVAAGRPKVELHSALGEPTSCKVWVGGVLRFDGVDRSVLIRRATPPAANPCTCAYVGARGCSDPAHNPAATDADRVGDGGQPWYAKHLPSEEEPAHIGTSTDAPGESGAYPPDHDHESKGTP